MSIRNLFGILARKRPVADPSGIDDAMLGYFEIRGDRLVGWTRDTMRDADGEAEIIVARHGRTIASCEATRQVEQKRFIFTLPIEGRFSAVELVTDDVIVTAHNRYGSGRVLLDGAAQLELIRDHIANSADNVFDLEFSRGGNARPYLGDGWYGPEDTFTWMLDHDSFVVFDAPTEPGTYALRLTTGAFIRRPELPRQDLDIFIDEMPAGRFVLTENYTQFQECRFSHELFTVRPKTTLRLHHPDGRRPSELFGHHDTRCLSFNVKRLSLVRLLEQG